MNLRCWLGACGNGLCQGGVGKLIEKGGGHLRATSIMNAGKQDPHHDQPPPFAVIAISIRRSKFTARNYPRRFTLV